MPLTAKMLRYNGNISTEMPKRKNIGFALKTFAIKSLCFSNNSLTSEIFAM